MDAAADRPIAAVVDLGTNAARLALASLDENGGLVSRGRWRELIRLGEGVESAGKLSHAAMERGLGTLRRFSEVIEEKKITLLDAVATSALREAANGKEFIAGAQILGIPLRVISAEEEARLALSGVMSTVDDFPETALIFDVGGGSLELIQAEKGSIVQMASVLAGVVYLTERYLTEMPTPHARIERCRRKIREMLQEAENQGMDPLGIPLIGCGGVVALTWFIREGNVGEQGINGVILEATEAEDWIPRFASLDESGRRALPGFEPGREDVALAGLLVVAEILDWTGQKSVQISAGGVREGRLLEMLTEASGNSLKTK